MGDILYVGFHVALLAIFVLLCFSMIRAEKAWQKLDKAVGGEAGWPADRSWQASVTLVRRIWRTQRRKDRVLLWGLPRGFENPNKRQLARIYRGCRIAGLIIFFAIFAFFAAVTDEAWKLFLLALISISSSIALTARWRAHDAPLREPAEPEA